MSKREFEFEQRVLDDGWVEIRATFASGNGAHRSFSYHGDEARFCLAQFALSFSSGVAERFGAHELGQRLMRLWEHVHTSSGCTCRNTKH